MLDVMKPKRGTQYPALPLKGRELKVTMVEACDSKDKGSMGARYIMNAANDAGFVVIYDDDGSIESDVQLVSVHHCSDWPRLIKIPKSAPLRIAGGHVTTNNVRPGIPFADWWCIGEGEEWIKHALRRVSNGGCLSDMPGTINSSLWINGSDIPESNTIDPLPRHPPYLNRDNDGHARVWYIELARGCPFVCKYCELGWSWKYRPQDTEYLMSQLDMIDATQSKRVTFFAPDEASHPGYADLLAEVHRRQLITSFGSMRFDQIMRKKNLPFKSNMLIRVAIDGLTEETRYKVSRRQSNDDIIEYFRYMAGNGHHNFKVFMIFGYPWETLKDFDEFEELMDLVFRYPVKKNIHLRVKFTPLIPQPSTPLGDCEPIYDVMMVERIRKWFDRVKRPHREPGWFVRNDGLMGKKTHAEQVRLTQADETYLEAMTCSQK